MSADTFPRQYARTRRFTLGEPRNVVGVARRASGSCSPAAGGGDRPGQLPVGGSTSRTASERLVADPLCCSAATTTTTCRPRSAPAASGRARRAGGITAYATDADVTVAAFALAGRLFVAGLRRRHARELRRRRPGVRSPSRPAGASASPTSAARTLCVAELDGTAAGWPATRRPRTISWGSAEFVAAEEMSRFRGYWWSPGRHGDRRRAASTSRRSARGTSATRPTRRPRRRACATRPPAPPTPTSRCTCSASTGRAIEVDVGPRARSRTSPRCTGPTPTRCSSRCSPATSAASRCSRPTPATGATPTRVRRQRRRVGRARARHARRAGRRPRSSRLRRPRRRPPAAGRRRAGHAGRPAGARRGRGRRRRRRVPRQPDRRRHRAARAGGGRARRARRAHRRAPACTVAVGGGDVVVLRSRDARRAGRRAGVARRRRRSTSPRRDARWCTPNVHAAPRRDAACATAVLLPHDHDGSPLPVLLDPYGGPHAQRVVAARNAFLTSQWFADQGFAVVVVDGRGTPGRGSALGAGRAPRPRQRRCSTTRSTRCTRPPTQHPARPRPGRRSAAGASAATSPRSPCCAGPTCSTPPSPARRSPSGGCTTPTTPSATSATRTTRPDAYDGQLAAAAGRPSSTRPLLLVHGLADDNVVAAHTLRLSSALLAAGRPHEVLPLVGVTHMTPQEVVAENLLLHQLDFLRRALRPDPAVRCDAMNEQLAELYRGVAVHATADSEHTAALELLALVMAADSQADAGRARHDQADLR